MYKKCNNATIQRYVAKHYDRIELRVPKGTRDAYRAHAKSEGMSLPEWIRDLMDTEMRKKTPKG